MKSKTELKNFLLKCLNPIFLMKVLAFLIGKIIERQKRYFKPYKFYPLIVKEAYSKLNKKEIKFKNVEIEEYTIDECELILCADTFSFKKESDWVIEFKDQEYTFALHRWNWLLTSLSNNTNNPAREWGLNMMRSWVIKMMDDQNGYAWHPYTTGERISNAFMFGILTTENYNDLKITEILPDDIKPALNLMAISLSNHLEYKGKGKTGNHVINNARALLFASILLDIESYSNLSFSILRSNLPELVSNDGFLREGSSHYQFIFTRWILEMLWLSKISKKCDIYDFLHPFSSKLVEQCGFFIVEDLDDDLLSIPLIGDVSPDFPVNWLISLPFSKLGEDVYVDNKLSDIKAVHHDWASLINQKPGLFTANL